MPFLTVGHGGVTKGFKNLRAVGVSWFAAIVAAAGHFVETNDGVPGSYWIGGKTA